MDNPFKGWTPAMVAAHNAKVGRKPVQAVPVIKPVTFKPVPSTDEEKLNKTERAFLNYLRVQKPECLHIQAISFKLGSDCRYWPDFITVMNGKFKVWEVKGFLRQHSQVKMKVVARMYSWAEFWMVYKDKDSPTGWRFEQVNP